MKNNVLFSSEKTNWETPNKFFDTLNDEFHFDVDVAASPQNAKCETYYTEADNGLSEPWRGVCWCNPPYGRDVGKWVEKAAKSAEDGAIVVMLLPARTDTRWFHKYIYRRAEIRFISGRLVFELNGKPILDSHGRPSSAPFPSMVVVFRKDPQGDDLWETSNTATANMLIAQQAYYRLEQDSVSKDDFYKVLEERNHLNKTLNRILMQLYEKENHES